MDEDIGLGSTIDTYLISRINDSIYFHDKLDRKCILFLVIQIIF